MVDKNLVRELKPHRRQVCKIALLQAAAALCTVATAYFFAAAVHRVFLKNAALHEVVPYLAVLLFVMPAGSALRFRVATKAHLLSRRVQDDLRLRLLDRFFSGGPAVVSAKETEGARIACLTEGIDQLDGFFTKFLPQCAAAAVIPPIALAAALSSDLWTGLLFLLTAPVIPIFMYLIGKQAEQANARQWNTLTRLSARFLDLLEGMTTLKIFNQADAQCAAVDRMSEEFRGATMRVLRVAFLSAFVLELAATLSVAITAVMVGLRLLDGQMDFARAFFLLLLAPEFYQPLRSLGSAFHAAITGAAAAQNIYRFTSAPIDMPRELPTAMPRGDAPFAIRFANVRCAYRRDRETALDDLTFTAPAGSHTAIVGMSGAGKSTIFQLLLRFIEPEQGEIFIADRQLKRITPQSLRTHITLLPQAPRIFALTAAQNIALAKKGASMEEIIAAAKCARIHDVLAALPDGYRTLLGAGGRALSGGQRQRIAIARAFLRDTPLLLLDEAMTGLDDETAQEIHAALAQLTRGKTLLTITHRPGTAARADHIIVLDGGKAVETGTHDELLRLGGLYAAFCGADRRAL